MVSSKVWCFEALEHHGVPELFFLDAIADIGYKPFAFVAEGQFD